MPQFVWELDLLDLKAFVYFFTKASMARLERGGLHHSPSSRIHRPHHRLIPYNVPIAQLGNLLCPAWTEERLPLHPFFHPYVIHVSVFPRNPSLIALSRINHSPDDGYSVKPKLAENDINRKSLI